ncbi:MULTISPECIES: chromosome partitioning protein ParA [unclassified Microcystis]|uniref:chromosome partitioning protein ParA n=1 Tax=unclassified Microcystis TaxID=2643300 RepID=UPI0011950EAD|nr:MULTISPECIES: chromosome partitioning protein ParA [unclassified Microcystis]MCA2925575.1 chromosome partitioning protein ParA [Microcystis sp. M020S1]MCA2935848.1 chromosome partitioning protein ParA [Microcystis sp. M015S1]MCA2618863.1 chromosome partitioning protein ParA [Microcystis sp. M099S2]MCA2650082.1 chromosome partitioning protein ParA [Microcystis sp. M065S2]MCA2681740.1 chromosome partitioning protein ParA [Microcystis sp. M043S2]
MVFSPCRLLIWTLFGLSFPVPSVLAEAIDEGKAIAPVTVAPSFCEGFTPLTNRVAPLVFEGETRTEELSDSACAKDLAGVGAPVLPASPLTEPTPAATPIATENPAPQGQEDRGWQIKFQPYATIPISTYGTATARGRTVSYHLDLGEVLQSLRVTGSARVEAWNGRFGLIFDGYYASLRNVIDRQKTTVRQPNFIDSLNWLLSRDASQRIQKAINGLEGISQSVDRIQGLKEEGSFQEAGDKIRALRQDIALKTEQLSQLPAAAEEVRDQIRQEVALREEQLQELETAINNARQRFQQEIVPKIEQAQELKTTLAEIRQEVQQEVERKAERLNEFKQALDSLQGQLAERQNTLQEMVVKIQTLPDVDIGEIRDNIDIRDLRDLEKKIAELPRDPAFSDRLGNLKDFQEKLSQIQEALARGQEKIQELRGLKDSEPLQQLQAKIQELRELKDSEPLQQLQGKIEELRQTKDSEILQQLQAKVQELQQLKDSEPLQQLQAKLQELRGLKDSEPLQRLEQEIQNARESLEQLEQTMQQVQEFADNRQLQQLEADSETNLQFDQGIYDFAVSYHIGDPISHELPEKPSNRSFPLIWFQPYAGLRLNSISIDIEQTLTVQLSSPLVNFSQTFQQTFSQGRTWFEPLLGGKFGVQVSDPITLWIRGDASGFGLAGDTDLSWNLLFGVDWWVNRQISLQFAYRFYGIEYKNGSGDNAFGFTENFNGPFLAATFHF